METESLIFTALQRIEQKLDDSIKTAAIHGERLATVEAKHASLEASVTSAGKWATYKSMIAYGVGMISHAGLGKIGIRI
jgi:hypothetical protein